MTLRFLHSIIHLPQKLKNDMGHVGSIFGAKAQQVGDYGPKSPGQWICRERVTELGLNEVSVS